MTTADVHTLTGAYALDAVTDLERAAFARHLAECPVCAGEVDEFHATAAKIGLATTVAATSRLRSRVLTEVAATRQLPPPAAVEPPHRRPWRKRATIALAAVAAAVAVLFGGIGIGAFRSSPEPTTQIAGPAPDMTSIRATATAGGAVVVSFSRQHGEAVVTAQALPMPAAGHTYQVWFIGRRGAQSAGLLPTGSGAVTAALPADVDRIGITTEPAAGSPQPTTPAVVRVPLT
ncbi:anti-sigma factor [Amycolatopsis benzoatilytica]|uniref:anti-sigma factor n=1 Tax=Amycolatopsis benzoatilytica TaxID=346045 RepID=UPI00036F6C6E|nr:anti-sigma factor [Amycolatopsis benzoatilytica]